MSEFSKLDELLEKLEAQHDIKARLTPKEREQRQIDWYNESVGNLNEIDGYNCDLCKNKGYIAGFDEFDNVVHRFCKCNKTRATLRRARESGLGEIITNYTFDKFNATEDWQKQLKNKARQFCSDDQAKWFYIGGQVGSGKTHICTAIVAQYIKKGIDAKYMLWCEESKTLKALVNDVSYHNEIAKYKDVEVLYIDDFLKVQHGEAPTPADIKLAFEIINRRLISRDKITIISSEKTLDELMEYDEATMSRIFQSAGQYKINISKDTKKNYRLRSNL